MEGKGSFWRFILLVTCVEPTLTIQSMAEVVYSDQRVQIYCRINSNTEFSQWSFTPVHNTTPIVLVSKEAGLDPNFKERYDFKQENADVLTIVRAQHQNAGRYTCKKVRNRSNISEFSTEVIVLYGNMSCGPTDAPQLTEGESLMLQCNISYSGNLRAVMQWTGSDNRPIDSQHQTQYTTTEKDAHYPTTATSTLRLTADRSTNRIMYICTVYFNTSAVSDPHDDDTSPKLYWTSPQITCQYKPRDVKISPVEKDDFYAGDSLTCTADALPEAEFIWKLEKNNKSYSGNTFTIEESSGIDEAFLLTCTAKNSLGSTDNSRSITIRSKYLLPASTAATIAVSCVLLVLLAVLAVYVIHLKRNGADVWKLVCSLEFNDKRQEPEQERLNVELVNDVANNAMQHPAEQYEAVAPVYASVHKPMNSKGVRLSPVIPKGKYYVGADGTEYMDLRGGGGCFLSAANGSDK